MGNSLTFGPVNSSDFDVIISGEGVFDAPKKDVEKVSIQGRNGDLIIDRNRYENITVSYPAYYYKDNMYDFKSILNNFRSALASQRGYQRLEDTFNPDEFRLGMFADGFEVDPLKHNTVAQFSIEFDCKPQRFLKSGEVPQEFTADGSIYNPTPFEAAPLLEVEGRGEIELNGYPIEINVDPLGEVPLFEAEEKNGAAASANFGNVAYKSGDDIHVKSSRWVVVVQSTSGAIYNPAPVGAGLTVAGTVLTDVTQLQFSAVLPEAVFTEGTSETKTYSANCDMTINGSSYNVAMAISLIYDGDKNIKTTVSVTRSSNAVLLIESVTTKLGAGTVDSTATSLNETLYIDCELGEAYTAGGQSYNNAVSLGANLPRLGAGSNEVVIPATIDALRIIPRWWRL